MSRLALLFALPLVCAVATHARGAAVDGDPLQAPECQQALAALHEQEAAAASAPVANARPQAREPRPLDPKLDAARRRAARSCLASRADPPVAGRLAQPPIAVPPVASVRPPLPAASPGTGVPARLAGPPPLVSITSCDAGGCWANDGSRLNRVGPNLWGPHGICTVQGTLVQCP